MRGRDSGIHFLTPGQQLVINLHMRNTYLCTTPSMSISNQVSRLGEGGACSVKMSVSVPDRHPRGSLACCSPWGRKESERTATEQQQCTPPNQKVMEQ